MPQIHYNLAPSLDGFIASPSHTSPWILSDPTIDFPALYDRFALFVCGRRTYDAFVGMGSENPFLAASLREKLVVLSRGEDTGVRYPGVRVERGDDGAADGGVCGFLKREIARLEENGGEGDVWILGGPGIASEAVKGGMLDVLEVAVMPVVVGEGVKMLGDLGVGDGGVGLELEGCERKESGIVILRYKVVKKGDKDCGASCA